MIIENQVQKLYKDERRKETSQQRLIKSNQIKTYY